MNGKIVNELYRKMVLIRKTELAIENLFSQGLLYGTTHGCIGQEAVAVCSLAHIDSSKDYITGNHRSHGHLLALTDDPYSLIAELMGKITGIVHGKGGSQHVKFNNFFTNGITGGLIPTAVGLAYGMKYFMKSNDIVVSFFGDGSMNEGYLLEAFNLSSCYKTPNLFILENNSYAMSTKTCDFSGNTFRQRIEGFGIDHLTIKAQDPIKMYDFFKDAIQTIRTTLTPIFIEVVTHRFSGHSKSDNREYIPKSEDLYWREHDPIELMKKYISIDDIQSIESLIDQKISKAIEIAKLDQLPCEKFYHTR